MSLYLSRLLLATAMPALLFACAGTPRASFYTLDAPAYPSAQRSDLPGLSVLLAPVSLPEMVDRQQMVVRMGENRVEIVDGSRWAQPLKSELARALAANLGRDLGTLRVFQPGQAMSGEPDVRVTLDVLRFESRPGIEATLEARWIIRRKEAREPLAGHALIHEAVRGETHESLAAAHGRALARIGHEISAAIRASQKAP